MHKKLKVNTVAAEELRFISPTGDIISSPEGHVHALVVEEKKLSLKTGFEGLLDVINKGYLIIASLKEEIMITHTKDLTDSQTDAISELEATFPNYKISLSKEEM